MKKRYSKPELDIKLFGDGRIRMGQLPMTASGPDDGIGGFTSADLKSGAGVTPIQKNAAAAVQIIQFND